MTTRRRRTLPQVSPKVSAELRPLVAAVKEIIEVGEGVRGDPLDRKVTLRDLVDGGVITVRGNLTGGGGTIEPNPVPPNLATPPKPTGFSAIGGFDGRIDLSWDIPGSLYSNHGYTNIYRAEEDNFANAILVGREAGAFYTDIVRDDVAPKPYYYWISFTSTSDIEGPLNDTAGTLAQAVDIDWIIDQLEGRITESELANELLAPIQAIPTIQTTLDDHGIRIPTLEDTVGNHAIQIPSMQAILDNYGPRIDAAEGTLVDHEQDITNLQATLVTVNGDLIANANAISGLDTRVLANETDISAQAGQISALQATLNDINIGPFDANANYAVGNLFRYDSVVYEVIATQTPPNATPPNATYYSPQPDYQSIADAVSANASAVNSLDVRVTAAEGELISQASDITLLQSDLSTAEGGITSNANAINSLGTRVTATENGIVSLSGDITTLNNSLTITNGNVTSNANAISSLQTEVSDLDGVMSSQSTDITQLQNDLAAAEGDIALNSGAINSLDSRVTSAEGTISSQGTALTNLTNSLDTLDGEVTANAGALSLLDNRVTSAEGTITSQGSAITQLQNYVQNLDVDGNAAAINSLTTRVEDVEGEVTATAQNLTQLEATVNGNTAAIQTKAEVSAVQGIADDVAVLSAQYTVKLDVNGRVAGIGIANNGGASEFIVASDAVYFIDPGQSITPFDPGVNYASMAAVRDTQLVFGYAEVEGFKRFVINVPAYIPEGYIESGMVGAISFGKITDAQGNPVTTVSGKLKADYIDVDNLAVASAATFYGDAQSGSYSPGTAGWRLQQSGVAEFNNVTVRGRVEADTGYIAQNVQIGGTSQDIGDMLALAENGNDAAALVDSWTKPGYTLIDGNKIFTGDAYVDTLQIKNNAVTFPGAASADFPGGQGLGYPWKSIASTWFDPDSPVAIKAIVVATATMRGVDFDYSTSTKPVNFRVLVGGTVVHTSSMLVAENRMSSWTRNFTVNSVPGTGATISLQTSVSGGGGVVELLHGSFVILGTKR